MPRAHRVVLPLAVGFALVVAACTGTDDKDAVAVKATDSKCEVATTTLAAGSRTFRVTNGGRDVTEVYVYGPGDEVKGEVENIGPGTSRNLTVKLGPGDYEVACKPGMKGDGIRTKIVVTGEATASVAPDRTVTFDAYDYGYDALKDLTFNKGETVKFVMTNTAPTEEHEFEVFPPKSKEALGEIGPTKPGATGTVTLTFEKAGTYTFECGITDHLEHGMKGTFTVR